MAERRGEDLRLEDAYERREVGHEEGRSVGEILMVRVMEVNGCRQV